MAEKTRHTSAFKSDIAEFNDGFREGVCHAIDELRELGHDVAADDLEARLFVREETPQQ